MNTYEICQVPTYKTNYNFAQKSVQPIKTIEAILHSDTQCHERLSKNDLLKLSVDVDKLRLHNPSANLEKIFKDICEYVGIDIADISYTTNFSVETGSHHIVISKYFMKSSEQKLFWKTFKTHYNYGKEIDADIFDKDGWFRLPNQTKEGVKGTQHIIQKGEINHFVLKYVADAIQYGGYPSTPIQGHTVSPDATDEETNSVISDITNPETKKEINKKMGDVMNIIPHEMQYYIDNGAFKTFVAEGNHLEYIKFGGMLLSAFSTEIAFEIWKITTIKNGSANKKKELEQQFAALKPLEQDPKKAINILKKWVKKYDPEIITSYNQLQNMPLENSYDNTTEYKDWLLQEAIITQTDVGFAKAFDAHFGDTFKATGGNYKTDAIWFYDNKTKLWNKDAGFANIRLTISNDLRNLFKNISNDECSEKKRKALDEVLVKLEKTTDKNNITREIYDFIIDTKFEKKLNNQSFLLPIKNNKIINMNTLEITDRTMNNYFSFECNAEYVLMTDAEEADIKKYLLDLFCGKEDTMKCMIDIIKSSLSGKVLRYIFFHTGNGRNGKSLFFKLLNNIFHRFMDIISKDVILQKKSNSHLNTEFEKLQTCRLAYITELTESDKLNNTNIKAISGGDPINLRTLQKTDATIIPTATNHILTNELPSFKEDSAMRDRIIVCPYNNVFMVNANFETEMMGKTNLLFSYIIKYGVIRDKFELTEEMKIATNEYNDDNSVDNLKEFINLRCEKVAGIKILRNDFVKCYNEWLLENYKPKDYTTSTKFTRNMKNKYKINSKESNHKVFYIDLQWKIEEPEV